MYMDEMNQAPKPPRVPRMGLAVSSLVLGALAVFLSFMLIGILLGLIGIVLGCIHLASEKQHRAMAGGGVFLSFVGLLMGAGFAVLYVMLFQETMPALSFDYGGNDHVAHWEGVRSPDLTLTDLDGTVYTLSELRGKRVVLFLFSSWSGDEPVEQFVQLVEDESAADLVVIGMSDDDEDELREYMLEMKINFPVAIREDLPSPYDDIFDYPTTIIIDRNGVIQTIALNYDDFEDYDALKSAALAADFTGTPVEALPSAREGLLDSPVTLVATELWSVEMEEGSSVETGDWDGDGNDEILISTWNESLEVLRPDGTPLTSFGLPESIYHVAMVAHQGGPRLIGFSNYAEKIYLMDTEGKVLWEYAGGWLPSVIQDVHWGDMDGDGNDEFAVSMMNGLHLVSEDGERIWRNRGVGSGSLAVVGGDGETARIYSGQFMKVSVFDGAGELRESFGVHGETFYAMHGIQIAPEGPVQLLFYGDEQLFAGTPSGEISWKVLRPDLDDTYTEIFCGFGDVDGDGRQEWLFQEGNGDLAAVSAEGARLGAVSGLEELVSYAVARRTNAGGALITLQSGSVTAYAFAPGTNATTVPGGGESPEAPVEETQEEGAAAPPVETGGEV